MNALDVLISQLNERVAMLSTAICNGNLETFEEYKKLCGEVRGLLTAEDYIKALKNKLETLDDE